MWIAFKDVVVNLDVITMISKKEENEEKRILIYLKSGQIISTSAEKDGEDIFEYLITSLDNNDLLL